MNDTTQAQLPIPSMEDTYVSDKEKLKFFLTVNGVEHLLSFEHGQFVARTDADEGDVYTAMRAEFERKGSALRTLCKRVDFNKARQIAQSYAATRMQQAAQGPLNSQHMQTAATQLLNEERREAIQGMGLTPAPGQPALTGLGASEADPKFKAAEQPIGTEDVTQPAPKVVEKLENIPIEKAEGFKFHQKNTNQAIEIPGQQVQ